MQDRYNATLPLEIFSHLTHQWFTSTCALRVRGTLQQTVFFTFLIIGAFLLIAYGARRGRQPKATMRATECLLSRGTTSISGINQSKTAPPPYDSCNSRRQPEPCAHPAPDEVTQSNPSKTGPGQAYKVPERCKRMSSRPLQSLFDETLNDQPYDAVLIACFPTTTDCD